MAKSVAPDVQSEERMRYLQRTINVPRQPTLLLTTNLSQPSWVQPTATNRTCPYCNFQAPQLWQTNHFEHAIIGRKLYDLERPVAKRFLGYLANNKAVILKGLISPLNHHCTPSYPQHTFPVAKS